MLQVPSIDGTLFRKALARFPSGVTLVTTLTEAHGPAGLTASAFCSLSMDPPLVLVCPAKTSQTYRHIQQSRHFAIHILSGEQSELAYLFAKSGNDVSHLPWRRSTHGNPILPGAVCTIECTLWQDYDGGDHGILVGQVVAIELGGAETAPLHYCDGQLGSFPPVLA